MATMTLAQVAELMNVSESNVRRWAKEKLLKPVDPAASTLEFEEAAVQQYKQLHDRLYGKK